MAGIRLERTAFFTRILAAVVSTPFCFMTASSTSAT